MSLREQWLANKAGICSRCGKKIVRLRNANGGISEFTEHTSGRFTYDGEPPHLRRRSRSDIRELLGPFYKPHNEYAGCIRTRSKPRPWK